MGDTKFQSAFEYKLIYAFAINDDRHRGYLKVGDATIKTNKNYKELTPNCRDLNQAAIARIKEYTRTAGIDFQLLYTEVATYVVNNPHSKYHGLRKAFRDHDVHKVLKRSGVLANKEFNGSKEWFYCDLETIIKAIAAVKNNQSSLSGADVTFDKTPVLFRPEQEEAIKKTLKQYQRGDRMLWNAKMRFGKTITALEVVKRSGFSRTIIITHRPVVEDGWFEDFKKIFYDTKEYVFGSKMVGEKIEDLANGDKKFVYFASMQDLRGSEKVGGKYDKNDLIFDIDWDLVVVDEAHEGTTTDLGQDVLQKVIKPKNGKVTKTLELSGTPFNLLDTYDDQEIYTWDYIMEQQAKLNWALTHFGDSNPYEELPKLNIYTYHLEETFKNYQDVEDKAFNFREFFKVYSAHDKDTYYKDLPSNIKDGEFVHANDVRAFLNLICKESETTNYPYSSETYRDYFRHTLWIVPGVKEAKALSSLLKAHPIFSQFEIVNVAGDGDEEIDTSDALEAVRKAMTKHPEDTRTITISCGRLTTGVTVPEWTAVLMLAGSYSTAAAQYLQTIFRVQSPANIDGKIKENCYVFDFAPDRTLKMIADSVQNSQKGTGISSPEKRLGDFLNFCPVISISQSVMQTYKVSELLQELKRAYVEKVVNSGFDDIRLYNDELLKLDDIELQDFENLKTIIGKTKSIEKSKSIDINSEGFTEEEYEEVEKIKNKPKKSLTPEELEKLEELKKKREQKNNAISILRGISIRIPLLVYGADVSLTKEITVEKFPELVDPLSWKEFMPEGVTKEIFAKFGKYYDKDVFVASTYRIRAMAKAADELEPTERVIKIGRLFSNFRNPDKETVLTPWRVVNLHMSQTIGGYDFFDEDHKVELEVPRLVKQEGVTDKIFTEEGKVLEINSKTGLYPLYAAYTFYRYRLNDQKLSKEDKLKLWDEVIKNNIFVICKTEMAKYITRRTLLGYRDGEIRCHFFEDLVNQTKEKRQHFVAKVTKANTWKLDLKGGTRVKFNAIVGNPPYQEVTAKHISEQNGQARRKSIFQYFQMSADALEPDFSSLIYPGVRWIQRSGKGMEQFGLQQINDKKLAKLHFYPNSLDIFDIVEIDDGISLVLKELQKTSNTFEYYYHANGRVIKTTMEYPGQDLMILNPEHEIIMKKVKAFVLNNKLDVIFNRVLSQKLFGIESNFVEANRSFVRPLENNSKIDYDKEVKLLSNDKAGPAGRARWFIINKDLIPSSKELINEWQVIVSSANAGGQKRDNQIAIVDNHSCFGRSRVALGSFKTEEEASNFFKYMNTDIVRFMFLMTDEALTSLGKKVPDLLDYTNKNPLVDFQKDLNTQLNDLIGLNEEEIAYIKDTLANLRPKRK